MYKYIAMSFGGGVQSSCLLLLIKHDPQLLLNAVGHLPDKAYFADTHAEPAAVYANLELMRSLSPIPIEVVSNGNLLSPEKVNGRVPRTFPPYFVRKEDGSRGMLLRKCTHDFKILPIQRAIRHDIGLKKRQRGKRKSVALWLGISIEEATRMRDNQSPMFQNIYPLVELGWDRTKCFSYCQSHGITPTKSRCIICPFINDWASVKRNTPIEFQKAVEFDRQLREVKQGGVKYPPYLHKSLKPLDKAVINQGNLFEGYFDDDFTSECTGVCNL